MLCTLRAFGCHDIYVFKRLRDCIKARDSFTKIASKSQIFDKVGTFCIYTSCTLFNFKCSLYLYVSSSTELFFEKTWKSIIVLTAISSLIEGNLVNSATVNLTTFILPCTCYRIYCRITYLNCKFYEHSIYRLRPSSVHAVIVLAWDSLII